jgi:hypothetical protein
MKRKPEDEGKQSGPAKRAKTMGQDESRGYEYLMENLASIVTNLGVTPMLVTDVIGVNPNMGTL